MAQINWDDPNLLDTSFDPSQRSPNTGINGGQTTSPGGYTFNPLNPNPDAHLTNAPAQPTNPTMPAGQPGAPTSFGHPVYDQIAKYFTQNHVTPTQQLVSQWGTNVDSNYMAQIAAQINRQYAPAAPTAPTAPTNTNRQNSWDENYFSSTFGRPGTVNDLLAMQGQIEGAGGKLLKNAAGQWNGKIQDPSGQIIDIINSAGLGGRGFQWLTGGGDAGGGSAGNQNNQLLQNELLTRLQQLHQPIADPMKPLYDLMSLARIGSLGGAPYTAGEDAALRAHYMDPLTQARDAAQQQAKERLSARGMAPTSGLLQSELGTIDKGYEQGVAQGSNDLAVQAINEKQRRADEQLSILSNMLQTNSGFRTEDNNASNDILKIAAMFPAMDQTALDNLLKASGDTGGSTPNSLGTLLAQLGQMNTNQTNVNNQNNQANQAAMGQYIGYIINALTHPNGAA